MFQPTSIPIPFEIQAGGPGLDSFQPAPLTLLSRTTGWVGGADRPAETWTADPAGLILKVAGSCDFYIAPDGYTILRLPGGPQPPDAALEREVLLGPALILALALRGRWCLHAGAALYHGRGVAITGESGQGKSTLSAYLGAAGAGWQRAGDDILPLSLADGELWAWPGFPQLKLPPEAQPGLNLPERVPLRAICVLQSAPPETPVSLQPLPPFEAIQALVRQTAAARLFSPELLGAHLAFCRQAAETVSFYRLVYPHTPGSPAAVRRLLQEVLDARA